MQKEKAYIKYNLIKGKSTMDIQHVLNNLTIEEKVALVSGTDFMYTNPIPRVNIPSIRMSDGPFGLRVQGENGDNGVTGSKPATAFPASCLTASGWNGNNLYKMGQAIGEEALYYGVDVILGPGCNIKRNPLCGRNFEYFSEDPLLSSEMAIGEIKGIQSNNVGTSLKHFALNNNENYRFMGNSICDKRAQREIYLKTFENTVKKAHPDTVMCAYNKINGEYCCQNKELLTDILRNEWGFKGSVISDWGATHDRVKGIKSGLDLEMPGDTDICRRWLLDALKNKQLSINELDKAVENILNLINKYKDNKKKSIGIDWDKHHKLAGEIAQDCAVLLKNNDVLPIDKNKKYLVIGELFSKTRYQGSGSSMINPTKLTTPKDAFDFNNIKYKYEKGYKENSSLTDIKLEQDALMAANDFDDIIIFLGQTDFSESEAADREDMSLPQNQLSLINKLCNLNKKIIVILYGGSPVELPFESKVEGILNMYLPGQNGGSALVNLLLGKVSPGGRLAETWPLKYSDVPFYNEYAKNKNEIYKESIYVGYRYYSSANKNVLYPFGYGLSYSKFEYTDINIKELESKFIISFKIKNIGNFDSNEVVQLYVAVPNSIVFRPKVELKGFKKIFLIKSETKNVCIEINKDDLKYWDTGENRWKLENGIYEFLVSTDCQTPVLKIKQKINGENNECPYSKQVNEIYRNIQISEIDNNVFEKMSGCTIPQKFSQLPINLESRFSDLQQTFFGKILFNAVLSVAKKQFNEASKMEDSIEKDNKIKGAIFLKRVLESNSLITMSMSGGKSFPYNFAQGFVELSNGHVIKAIRCFLNKIKVPKLPKEE